ncbi:MAG: hypothetical protein COA97_05280 [Flavobacteriales bacterium]|nr:MAG: hypothetical protein COA97_05280 [Flavobacteriales bacterium]
MAYRMQNLKSFVPAILWLLIILVLSGYPGNHLPKLPVWQFDKLIHSIIYAILSICMAIAFNKQYVTTNNRLQIGIIIVLICVFYGGLMEILQNSIFINRSGNWYDFIANTIGAIIGVLIYPLVANFFPFNRWLGIK